MKKSEYLYLIWQLCRVAMYNAPNDMSFGDWNRCMKSVHDANCEYCHAMDNEQAQP